MTRVKATAGASHGFDVDIGETRPRKGKVGHYHGKAIIGNYHNKDDIGEYYSFNRDIGYRKRRIGMFGSKIGASGTR